LNTLTKTFVLLQLVLALVLAVLVILFADKQRNYRAEVALSQKSQIAAQAMASQLQQTNSNLQTQLTAALQAAAQKAGQLNNTILDLQSKLADDQTTIAQLRVSKSQLQASITDLTNTVSSLNKQVAGQNAVLTALRPKLLAYVNQNAGLGRRITELTNERNVARKTIEVLQESIASLHRKMAQMQVAARTSSPIANALSTAVAGVPTSVQVNGMVMKVATYNGHTYVSASLGTRDGVVKGTRLTIYSNGRYIGDVVVQKSDATESVGVVSLQAPGTTIAPKEMVMSGPGI
jgi:peptidoglycan hydrolase CwlO-like protein